MKKQYLTIIPTLFISFSASAYTGTDATIYFYEKDKALKAQAQAQAQQPKIPNINDLIAEQNRAFNQLVKQQEQLINEIKDLKKENKEIREHMRSEFIYNFRLKQEEIKKQEEQFAFLGFKGESVGSYFARLGLTDLVKQMMGVKDDESK